MGVRFSFEVLEIIKFFDFLFILIIYRKRMLGMTSGILEIGGIRWELLFCLIIGWAVVYLVICKGIHQSGKVLKIKHDTLAQSAA